jgi:hypothetical protein
VPLKVTLKAIDQRSLATLYSDDVELPEAGPPGATINKTVNIPISPGVEKVTLQLNNPMIWSPTAQGWAQVSPDAGVIITQPKAELILDAAADTVLDFDGDGKADIGVYRDGAWYILRSSDGGMTVVGWGGAAGDEVVPADYDGDGKTDVAIYRSGAWFIVKSSGGTSVSGWGGAAQDVPVPADYDGDGKADIAVYRDGAWFIRRSTDSGTTVVGWGGFPQDIPVPADYDGDGKADIAVYREEALSPTQALWHILPSSTGGGFAIQWGGAPEDIPLLAW